ncbi:hypothetical protein TNCT_42361 [Trichonephila clavata]|uniref:Uncharacterized protein n=1 Tax=Trichonephila clavata TaxID=2740835 RepID=A0A8X6J151_TRICU|nr:hypothetical protein TNCT_42361 [Trichonephila clavata]
MKKSSLHTVLKHTSMTDNYEYYPDNSLLHAYTDNSAEKDTINATAAVFSTYLALSFAFGKHFDDLYGFDLHDLDSSHYFNHRQDRVV